MPLQVGSGSRIRGMVPKLFVYEKSALTPILTKKFKNAGGGIGGLSQKFFRHFQNSKIGRDPQKPNYPKSALNASFKSQIRY
jgi:hypothetical protein